MIVVIVGVVFGFYYHVLRIRVVFQRQIQLWVLKFSSLSSDSENGKACLCHSLIIFQAAQGFSSSLLQPSAPLTGQRGQPLKIIT